MIFLISPKPIALTTNVLNWENVLNGRYWDSYFDASYYRKSILFFSTRRQQYEKEKRYRVNFWTFYNKIYYSKKKKKTSDSSQKKKEFPYEFQQDPCVSIKFDKVSIRLTCFEKEWMFR